MIGLQPRGGVPSRKCGTIQIFNKFSTYVRIGHTLAFHWRSTYFHKLKRATKQRTAFKSMVPSGRFLMGRYPMPPNCAAFACSHRKECDLKESKQSVGVSIQMKKAFAELNGKKRWIPSNIKNSSRDAWRHVHPGTGRHY